MRRRRDPENRRRVLVEMTRRGAGAARPPRAPEHFATIEKLGRAFVPPVARGDDSGSRFQIRMDYLALRRISSRPAVSPRRLAVSPDWL